MITFFVLGSPKAQPRPRAFARKMGGKFVARVYDAGTAEGWKSEIAIAARKHLPREPLAGPLRVDIDVFFARPKCLLRRKDPDGLILHTARPDVDNLTKAVCDCMTTLGFWGDDAQIAESTVRKYYTNRGGPSGARITIKELQPSGFSVAAAAVQNADLFAKAVAHAP